MIKFKSLNSRLRAVFSVLLIVVCLFFARMTMLLVDSAQTNAYQSVLNQQVAQLEQMTAEDLSSHQYLLPDYVQLYEEAKLPEKFSSIALSGQRGDVWLDGNKYLFAKGSSKDSDAWVLLMNSSTLEANEHLNQFMPLLFNSVIVGALILSLLSTWYLAKWLSTPIQHLTQDVALRAKNQETAIYGVKRADEIGQLAKALEASYSQIEALLQREQNFTRDVSHELRTPITLIKNTLSLNQNTSLHPQATEVIFQAAKELEQTVEVLLALARQENLQFTKQPIVPIVEKSILSIYNRYPQANFNVDLEVDNGLMVTGNEYLISLLCQNLVNNGFYHSNSAGMHIYSKGNTVIFENAITGNESRPYYQGLGHGQYLMTRIAEEMHWQLKVEQSNNRYKVEVLTS
ncbi:sensor histidine kinase [Glaciecola sp. 1036]|uniref:sensor histidine kinase n=1 Tax=Alteromonadaceae TaxID=72275 RepID=UPI003D02A7D2